MRKRYSEQQIAHALRLAEQGATTAEVCRQLGISDATLYAWKKKYAGMGVAELRRVKPGCPTALSALADLLWVTHTE